MSESISEKKTYVPPQLTIGGKLPEITGQGGGGSFDLIIGVLSTVITVAAPSTP